MNLKQFTLLSSLSMLAFGGAFLAPAPAHAAEPEYEELTRGPVHEAFAGAVSFDPEPGMLVRTAPPELIEEIPPEQELAGDNVAWIPGYWGWEEDQNDFIWISGIWRNLPPGRQWVPGYWGEAGDQWQWTSGYWAEEDVEEVAYLPEPPKSIETGPNVEAPSESHIWVSGTWVHRQERYAWRPGYWELGQPDWTWIPAHYRWTPYGYIFIDGYWDYNVVRRGVVFAPVRFHRSYYNRPDHYYTPLMVISLNVFANHLFVRPSYGHYYFGDYYAPRYRTVGFYDSYSYHSGRRGYDPIYVHDRWEHRSDRNWDRVRRDRYYFYRDNEDARPPRTWAALSSRPEGSRRGQRDDFDLAQPLGRYAERREGGQRFQTMSKERRAKLVEQRQEIRKSSQERKRIETRSKAESAPEKRGQVKREKLVKSPVVAKRTESLSGKDLPPKRRVTRDADLQEAKTAGRNGREKADPPKRGDKGAPEERGTTGQFEEGKRRITEQERNKSARQERAQKPSPTPGADTRPGQKGEKERKDTKRNDIRPAPKPEMENGRKEIPPSRKPEQVNPSKKQAERPETTRKPEPRVTPKSDVRREAKPQGRAAPTPPKAKEKQKEDARRTSAPIRNQAPARQTKRDEKPSLQPAKRQAETKRQATERPAKRQASESPRKMPQVAKHRIAQPSKKAAQAPKQARESERKTYQEKPTQEERAEKKKNRN